MSTRLRDPRSDGLSRILAVWVRSMRTVIGPRGAGSARRRADRCSRPRRGGRALPPPPEPGRRRRSSWRWSRPGRPSPASSAASRPYLPDRRPCSTRGRRASRCTRTGRESGTPSICSITKRSAPSTALQGDPARPASDDKPHGAHQNDKSAAQRPTRHLGSLRPIAGRGTARWTSAHGYPTAPGRTTFASCCWSPTTTPTTSASSWRSGAGSVSGRAKRLDHRPP